MGEFTTTRSSAELDKSVETASKNFFLGRSENCRVSDDTEHELPGTTIPS